MVDDSNDRIRRFLAARGHATSTEVAALLGISRQAAHKRLRAMVDAGAVVQAGAARATRYHLATETWQRVFSLDGLAEDRVLTILEDEVPAVAGLEPNADRIFGYATTELVNNAIDHSGGETVRVTVARDGATLVLEVEDDGVGAFAHVRSHLNLDSDLDALQEISKGKTTTAPERHSGEGLFFVSKAVDVFRLESGRLAWISDNVRADMAVQELDAERAGTKARVELAMDTPRELQSVFEEYTRDHEFDRTRIVIKLFDVGVRFVSRSEAKRLVHGLERFREVVLDFAGVTAIGQGFADEIFRVWARTHPEVTLSPVHMVEPVAFMVRRAQPR